MSQFSVPASLIRQHHFCPRIPFFNEVRRINPSDRPWQEQGVTYHKRQKMLSKRRNLSRYGLDNGELKFDVHLHCPGIGCHGIADGIIFTEDQLAIIEFKISGQKPQKGQILQAGAYGIMAESQFHKPCKYIFVLMGNRGKTFRFTLDTKLRNDVLTSLEAIQDNLNQPLLPHSPATDLQCGQCEYLNFCGDR